MFHQASDHGGQAEFNPAEGLAYPPEEGELGYFPATPPVIWLRAAGGGERLCSPDRNCRPCCVQLRVGPSASERPQDTGSKACGDWAELWPVTIVWAQLPCQAWAGPFTCLLSSTPARVTGLYRQEFLSALFPLYPVPSTRLQLHCRSSTNHCRVIK